MSILGPGRVGGAGLSYDQEVALYEAQARKAAEGFNLTPDQLASARAQLGPGVTAHVPNRVTAVTSCDLHGNAQPVIFACAHCLKQDEVHPTGIWLMPARYFLCEWCYRKYSLRAMNWYHLLATCLRCVMIEVERIKKINPTLFHDLGKD